ncbi:hypothetical protein L596_006496 [Steinernema carpocapsae]|uniref:Helicase ATP-binding domain-containing protein n=1 Tax=Steinernema carpocapsae TaxID=34508 RepID=A0A4U8V287_STECR|nr:hypothetical protein L596_006496 [Steinernema carpocapsae]
MTKHPFQPPPKGSPIELDQCRAYKDMAESQELATRGLSSDDSDDGDPFNVDLQGSTKGHKRKRLRHVLDEQAIASNAAAQAEKERTERLRKLREQQELEDRRRREIRSLETPSPPSDSPPRPLVVEEPEILFLSVTKPSPSPQPNVITISQQGPSHFQQNPPTTQNEREYQNYVGHNVVPRRVPPPIPSMGGTPASQSFRVVAGPSAPPFPLPTKEDSNEKDLWRLVRRTRDTESTRTQPRKNADLESMAVNSFGNLRVSEVDRDVVFPAHLTGLLKPHQVAGIRFMYDNVVESTQVYESSEGFGCILAHNMGLGKTLQVITFTHIFHEATPGKRIAIVVPVNTIQNWADEYDKWYPENWNGSPCRKFPIFVMGDSVKSRASRAKLLDEWCQKKGVLIIGYEMIRILKESPEYIKNRIKAKAFIDERTLESQLRQVDYEYEIITRCLTSPGPDLVICDEGHRIKNLKTDTSNVLKDMNTKRRIVLTGYPVQNNLGEYYCMVDYVRPGFLGTKKQFAGIFERPIANGNCIDSTPADVSLAMKRIHVLTKILRPFVQRKGPALLKVSLPPCTEYVVYVNKSPIQRYLYREFFYRACTELNNNGTAKFNPLKAYAICVRIWNHPDLLKKALLVDRGKREKAFERKKKEMESRKRARNSELSLPPNGDSFGFFDGSMGDFSRPTSVRQDLNYEEVEDITLERGALEWAQNAFDDGYIAGVVENSSKMRVAFELIDAATALGDKILFFSQSVLTLDLVETLLKARMLKLPEGRTDEWSKGKTYLRFDGGTKGSDRQDLIKRYNGDSSVKLFLISTKAGSLGVNLVSANRVIIFDVSWNPCHDAQAICRIYRFGQTKNTFVYRLVMDNSMERTIYKRQISKQGMQVRVVDEKSVDANVKTNEIQKLMVYDERLDLEIKLHDPDQWDIQDSVLRHVTRQFTCEFAERPELHEANIILRDDELTEEEKWEAERWFEEEVQKVERQDLDRASRVARDLANQHQAQMRNMYPNNGLTYLPPLPQFAQNDNNVPKVSMPYPPTPMMPPSMPVAAPTFDPYGRMNNGGYRFPQGPETSSAWGNDSYSAAEDRLRGHNGCHDSMAGQPAAYVLHHHHGLYVRVQ